MRDAATEAVPVLLRAADDIASVRWNVYQALRDIGPGAREAVPTLLNAVGFEAGEARVRAAEALERVEPGHGEAVDALVESLSDESRFARRYAAEILGTLGRRARPAVPLLIQNIRQGSDRDLIIAAADALEKVDADRGVDHCLSLLESRNAARRRVGVLGLGSFRSRATVVLPALLEVTRGGVEDTVVEAIHSIGRLGQGGKRVVSQLLALARGGSPRVVVAAAVSLAALEVTRPEAMKLYSNSFEFRQDGRLLDAIERLSQVETKRTIEMLLTTLEQPGLERKTGAMKVLARLEPPAFEAFPALEALALDPSDELARRARDALRSIRAKADRVRAGAERK